MYQKWVDTAIRLIRFDGLSVFAFRDNFLKDQFMLILHAHDVDRIVLHFDQLDALEACILVFGLDLANEIHWFVPHVVHINYTRAVSDEEPVAVACEL